MYASKSMGWEYLFYFARSYLKQICPGWQEESNRKTHFKQKKQAGISGSVRLPPTGFTLAGGTCFIEGSLRPRLTGI